MFASRLPGQDGNDGPACLIPNDFARPARSPGIACPRRGRRGIPGSSSTGAGNFGTAPACGVRVSLIKVAAAQMDCRLADIGANHKLHLELIEEAQGAGVDLIVFPELSLTGYDVGHAGPMLARELDDPMLLNLAQSCRGITAVVGLIELGFAAQLHNSTVALRDGRVVFLHRKLNLPNYGNLEEGKHFASGRYLDSMDLKKPWHAGILSCADAWNPALVHLLTLRGATLMMVPTNSATDSLSHHLFENPQGWQMALQFYSYIYGLPIVFANRVGRENGFEFWGGSRIFDSHGELLAAGGSDEELVMAEMRYEDVVKARASLPTVRDSNLDLIHREIGVLRDRIGHPSLVRPQL